MSAVAVNF